MLNVRPARPGRQIMRINPEIFGSLRVGTTVSRNTLPRDARLVGRSVDWRGDLLLLWESDEFPEVPEGGCPPEGDFVAFTSPDPGAARTAESIQAHIGKVRRFHGIDPTPKD